MTVLAPPHATSEAYRKADYVSVWYLNCWAFNIQVDYVTLC